MNENVFKKIEVKKFAKHECYLLFVCCEISLEERPRSDPNFIKLKHHKISKTFAEESIHLVMELQMRYLMWLVRLGIHSSECLQRNWKWNVFLQNPHPVCSKRIKMNKLMEKKIQFFEYMPWFKGTSTKWPTVIF